MLILLQNIDVRPMCKVCFVAYLIALFFMGCSGSNNPLVITEEDSSKSSHDSLSIDIAKLNCRVFLLDSSQHYRGLTVDHSIVFVTGSKGHVAQGLLSDDSIKWRVHCNVDSLHLRDIEVVSDSIFVLSIGAPGFIKSISKSKITDDRSLWNTTYFNSDSNVFMDGFSFWDNGYGLTYGDPLNEFHFLLKTKNYGKEWIRIDSIQLPKPAMEEAGFAASGTGLACIGDGVAFVGWGGVKARIFKTIDYGESWCVQETPIAHGKAGKGIYCMAWKNQLEGVVAGGNWEEPAGDSCYAYTKDGGETWKLGIGGSGYRSGICHVEGEVYCSVGSNGTDLSVDGGATWVQINKQNMNAVVAVPSSRNIIAIGSKGRGFLLPY